jgi:hypothetical protein
MAEFMNQNDMHQLLSFINDCFLTKGVDPLNFEADSAVAESQCFISYGSAGLLLMWMVNYISFRMFH